MFPQVTPIFASAHFKDGGLGLKTSELALPMAAGGIVLTLFALLVYPRLQPRLGMLWSCRLGLLIMVPTALLTPVASIFISNGSWQPGQPRTWLWLHLIWGNGRRRRWWHHRWQHSQYHQSFWQYVGSQARSQCLLLRDSSHLSALEGKVVDGYGRILFWTSCMLQHAYTFHAVSCIVTCIACSLVYST